MASASVSAAGLLIACLGSVGRFWANSPTNGASKLWDAPCPPLSCPGEQALVRNRSANKPSRKRSMQTVNQGGKRRIPRRRTARLQHQRSVSGNHRYASDRKDRDYFPATTLIRLAWITAAPK